MFSVKHNECVGFDSRWEVKKVYLEGSTQTPLYVSKSASTETNERKEVEIQTETPEALKKFEIDVDKLAGFLTKIYPKVKRELDEATSSRAFDGYKLQNDELDATSKLIQTVEVIPSQCQTAEVVNAAKLSSVSWNCSGKTLAISLAYPHQSWCYDRGHILIYTLDKEDKLPSLPTKKMSCDSCVSHIKFHPLIAGLLVGTTHGGGIYLWNIQNNEDDMLLTKISRTDDVSYLDWMTLDHVTFDVVFLVTASLNGTITMWRFNNAYTCANVYERYKIKTPLLTKTKSSKSNKTPPDTSGVTCFDFSKHFTDMFLVGTEGGLVVQCSTSKPTKLKGGTENDPLYDPVYQYYQKHEGSVLSISWSKERNDIFMTSGSDLQTRIYVVGQEEPGRIIFFNNAINPLSWVLQEKYLAFGYGSKCVDVYNVITGKVLKKEGEIEASNSVLISAICCVNPRKTNYVLVGMQKGVLELWSMPWRAFGKMVVVQ